MSYSFVTMSDLIRHILEAHGDQASSSSVLFPRTEEVPTHKQTPRPVQVTTVSSSGPTEDEEMNHHNGQVSQLSLMVQNQQRLQRASVPLEAHNKQSKDNVDRTLLPPPIVQHQQPLQNALVTQQQKTQTPQLNQHLSLQIQQIPIIMLGEQQGQQQQPQVQQEQQQQQPQPPVTMLGQQQQQQPQQTKVKRVRLVSPTEAQELKHNLLKHMADKKILQNDIEQSFQMDKITQQKATDILIRAHQGKGVRQSTFNK